MTVVVATLGSAGDLHPFLAIARALHEAGEDVLFLGAEPHRVEVEREGLPFEAILSAHDHRRCLSHPALWHPIRGFGVLWRHMAVGSLAACLAILKRESDRHGAGLRVVASPLVLGARLAADWLPIRLTTAHTAPHGLRSCDDPLLFGSRQVPSWTPVWLRRLLWGALDHYKLQPLALPAINTWRQQHGLPSLAEPVFGQWLHSPHQVLGLFPPTFGPMAQDWPRPVEAVGFPLFEPRRGHETSPSLQGFLGRHGAAWVVYPGSAPTAAASAMRDAAQRLAASGQAVLLIDPEDIATPQPNLHKEPWVCLPEVLSHARGFLHHGGIGATAQGLTQGVRQWICPSAFDQFDNAIRLSLVTHATVRVPAQGKRIAEALLKAQTPPAEHAPPCGATRSTRSQAYSHPDRPNAAVQLALRFILNRPGF